MFQRETTPFSLTPRLLAPEEVVTTMWCPWLGRNWIDVTRALT
jgi:hypothetical protein